MDLNQAMKIKVGDAIKVNTLLAEVIGKNASLREKEPVVYLWTNFGNFLYTVCEKISTVELNYYINFEGKHRIWKYEVKDRPKGVCYDCGIPYRRMADLHLPNKIWEKINPCNNPGGGLLCPNCICDRLRIVGESKTFASIYPAKIED